MNRTLVGLFCCLLLLVSLASEVTYAVVDAPSTLSTSGTRTASSDEEAPKYKKDELLVKFREQVLAASMQQAHQRYGSEKIKEFPSLRLHVVKIKKGLSLEEAIALYQADPAVEYAEPNFRLSIQATPNDPYFGQLWNLHNGSGADIDAPEAWSITTGSKNVVVAVLDTGIEYTHQDLSANVWRNPGEIVGNGIDDDSNGYIDDVYGINTITGSGDPKDDNYHGTHVSGIIGATGNNGVGVVGVNWTVKLLSCKFLNSGGSGYTSDAIECLQYVRALKDKGVGIVTTNNSWGCSYCYSQALYDAIKAQKDILFMASAGNSGYDTDKFPSYPAAYDLPNIIAVAATDSSDAMASWSNYGKYSVHVGAPGYNIYSTYINNSYAYLSGTSMAAPHVAGIAALLKAQDNGRDWAAIRNLILSGGDNNAALNGYAVTGKRVDAYGSLSCRNAPLFSILQHPNSLTPGVPTTLSVLSINCDAPVGPVTVTLSGGQSIPLKDDGIAPDPMGRDGVYTGTWTPASGNVEVFTFTSPLGQKKVAAPPVSIATPSLTPPALDIGEGATSCASSSPCTLAFSANDGVPPYTWSIVSGGLPPGMTINNASGTLSGTPSADGIFKFTIEVADAIAMSDRKDWSIVVNSDLRSGWPKELKKKMGYGGVPISASPVFADLDGDGADEIIVGDGATLYIFNAAGLVAKTTLSANISAPAVADLDGDGYKEIVVTVGWPSTEPPIHAFHHDLTPVAGFPAGKFPSYSNTQGYPTAPIISDLDGDGTPEIVAVSSPDSPSDPNYYKYVIIAVDAQGDTLPGWPQFTGETFYGTVSIPAIGDVDNDGKKEIIIFSRNGLLQIFEPDGVESARWVVPIDSINPDGAYLNISPILADMDRDGYLDVILKYYVPYTATVYVYNRLGLALPGWPREFPSSGFHHIVADLDRDEKPEIILTGDEWYVIRNDGSIMPGWPYMPNGGLYCIDCNPVVGDINGDGKMEILIGTIDSSYSGYVWALSSDGKVVPGYPKNTTPDNEIRTSPALGDIDGNGKVDIAVKSEDGMLYVWEAEETSSSMLFEWPMFRHDTLHSGMRPDTLRVVTSSLASGKIGTAYTGTLKASGGIPPVTWSISSGSLPPGLSLDGKTGGISGVPSAAGTFSFTVQGTDAASFHATKSLSIAVNAVAYTITATAGSGGSIVPSGTVTVNHGASQSFTITASSGYRIEDVKVDGTSVGAVSSYTFSNVTAAHTIAATFTATSQKTYVSDLAWVGTPVNGWGPVERDMSNGEKAAGDGQTITLNGVTYSKGLGVHAASSVTYTLSGKYTRFVSDIGVDDEVGSAGSIIFQVWADGTKLYDSGTMTGSSATKKVDVDVTGKSQLKLMVNIGATINSGHGDWAGAYLVGGTQNLYPLTVSKAGTGSGTVSSSPSGISCGTDCSEQYTAGTLVTLTASADAGSSFSGWSGNCSGTGTCQVTMNAARTVTATFSAVGGTETIIVDNQDANTSRTGTWRVSSAPNPYGADSLWSNGGNTFTWYFTPSQSGTFEVSLWWTTDANRGNNIPVDITYQGGTQRVYVNQLSNGGQWNSLGSYPFEGGKTYKVTTTALPYPIVTSADAIKVSSPSSPPSSEVIIDNRDTANTSRTGLWQLSGAPNPYGTDSWWSRDGATFSWIFKPSQSGSYSVSMWWTEWSSRSTSIPVDIEHAGGKTRLTINQLSNGGKWNSLGTYSFEAGKSYKVTITAQPGPTSTCADAVRFSMK